jgi:hypothetical protein
MLTKISLIVALCSNLTTAQIQSKLRELENQNPGSTVTLRLDKKAQCDAQGNVIKKTKKKRAES